MNFEWASLPDIPRVLTALAEWLACVYVVSRYKKRMTGWKMIAFCGIALVIHAVYFHMTGQAPGITWALSMVAAVLGMAFFIHSVMECDWLTCGYRCAEAFIIAELTAALQWLVYCYNDYVVGRSTAVSIFFSMIFSYILIYAFLNWINSKGYVDDWKLEITSREFFMAIIFALVIFISSNISFLTSKSMLSGLTPMEIFRIRALVDLVGLVGIYAYRYLLIGQRSIEELIKMEAMLQAQYQQYQMSKEVQDLINYKYHDLKQYITVLRKEKDRKNLEGENLLDRIESEIEAYEIQNKTGNEVLDTILTSKSIACRQQGIHMTSVADGSLLSFMDTMDICSIFGNALDNAIEYESHFVDKEQRLIHMTVFSQQDAFLVIRFENYCEAKMTLEDKLPKTWKGNADFHGYGLRSIQHTVHKYGGEISIETKNNWFSLRILIPFSEKEKKKEK